MSAFFRSVLRPVVAGVMAVTVMASAAMSQTAEPIGWPTSAEDRMASWQQHLELQKSSVFRDLKWRAVGPKKQGGRIESIACPAGNTSVMYVGVGSGGLWKTVNKGTTWNPVFQDQSTCAIGDVAVAKSNSDIVWVGTGEVLMARSAIAGTGIFKSTDAGQTWKNMGLNDTHHIGRVLIHPTNPDVVYVAAIGHQSTGNQQRGVFRTTDGGKNWDHVLYINDQTAVIDMVFDPVDANTLYATSWDRDIEGQSHFGAESGVHKSTDAGTTWRRLEGGLPSGKTVGRLAIDVAASNPHVVYVLADDQQGDGLYRSNDAGQTWKKVNQKPLRVGWDWCEVRVSPDNENELYNIGQKSFVSQDGGRSFREIGGKIVRLLPHQSDVLHLDTHAMWIDPLNTDHVVFGNDGGLFMSYDRCQTWMHFNNLPIAEVYAVTCDMQKPYNIYIGTQDNAALFGPSNHDPSGQAVNAWQQVYVDQWGGGDSYFTFRDPSDWDSIYYEHQYGDLRRKVMSTGETKRIQPRSSDAAAPFRFAWMTPYFPSAYEPKTLYLGANRVVKSTNRGDKWSVISPDLTLTDQPPRNVRYNAITALEESPVQQSLLYAGTDTGNLFVTENDGDSWKAIHDGLPRYPLTRVTASVHSADTVYVTLVGLGSDDFAPYVYASNDRGATWRSMSSGLPLEPVRVIREDPEVPGLLYIGTDQGVYVSLDAGKSWQSLCNHLPTAQVDDLYVHSRDHELVAGTHGLSVFVLDISPIRKFKSFDRTSKSGDSK